MGGRSFMTRWRLCPQFDKVMFEEGNNIKAPKNNGIWGEHQRCYFRSYEGRRRKISMDGTGRCMTTAVWRSLKHEDVI